MTRFKMLALLLVIGLSFHYGVPTRADNTGTIVADLGFRPATDGFSFENYGNDQVHDNLTPALMQRMFGDVVCASQKNGTCTLIPPAQAWMDENNKSMDDGHCEGMSALSLLFYTQKEKASDFGADKTSDLSLDNVKLQEEIAYYFATQSVSPTDSSSLTKTPADIVKFLIDQMKAGNKATETYTLGISQPDGADGHAVTPYAIVDRGNGIYWIMIYDNNYPGEERHIEVNSQANTWSYVTSTNPSEAEENYQGDADTQSLQLTPSSARLQKQICNFCNGSNSTGRLGGLADAAPAFNQLWLDSSEPQSKLSLLITDDQGHKMGQADGKLYREILGGYVDVLHVAGFTQSDPEPVYYIPTGISFTVTVDGSQITKEEMSSVTMIGPGYDLSVDDIKLEPGEKDTIVFSPDGSKISYTSSHTESPTITVGIEQKGDDYEFEVKGVSIEANGTITIGLNSNQGQLSIDTANNTEAGTYHLAVTRITDTDEETFTHDGLQLNAGDTAYVDFGKWPGQGQDMTIEIDSGSNGSIDNSTAVSDQK